MDTDSPHNPEKDQPEGAEAPPPGGAPRRCGIKKPLTARRLRRKIWRVSLFLIAGLLVSVLVLTRTGVTRVLVLPRLEKALGADIEASSVVVTPDLSILVRNPRVRVPGIEGPGGELFTAERLLVEIDWGDITSPSALKGVELEAPILRLSQNARTGELNATRLGIFDSQGSGAPIAIPTVIVRNGRFELGEHTGPDQGADPASAPEPYAVLAEFPISGVLAPQTGDTSGRSYFALTRRAGESGLEVTGYLDSEGVTCTLGGVDLNDWPAHSIPTRFRDLWSRLQLKGRIVPRTIAVGKGKGVEITVDLESVAMTLPFVAENARSSEPARLTDVSGRFFVSDERISAELTGRADALEQRVQFDLFGFDPRTAPFVARLVTPRLRWERDIALLDYVPPDVIEQTDRFGKPEADVEAVVWLARKLNEIPRQNEGLLARFVKPDDLMPEGSGDGGGPGETNADAVRMSGTLAMRRGAAAFRGFPYTFHDLSVDFRFNTKRLLVENIDGVSASGARLTGGGWISPLGPTSAVDLDLAVSDLVIDDELLAALNPARRQMVDVLFNQREYAELVEAGLVRTAAQAAPLLERLRSIEAERAAWAVTPGIGASERARLDDQASAIRAELERVPVFEPGGRASVDMRFIRQEGEVSIWTRAITLDFPEVGFLTEMFPLPAIGRDVRVEIGEDELTLTVEKGRAITGGSVRIDAVMDNSDEARAASPDGQTLPTVRVEARDIPIDPMLIRAVAGPDSALGQNESGAQIPDQSMGPIRLADLLNRLGLDGVVDADADIVPTVRDARSTMDYTIRTRLRGLTADIAEAGATMTGGSGTATATRDSVDLEIRGDLLAKGSPARAPGATIAASITLPEGADWGQLRDSEGGSAEGGPAEGGSEESGSEESGRAAESVRPIISATVVLPRADLGIPAAPIVGLFDANAASKLSDLRARHNPEGRVGVTTTIDGTLGPDFARTADIRVALTDLDRVDFDYNRLRLSATSSTGAATVVLGESPRVTFDGFTMDLETVDAGARTPAGRLGVLAPVEIGEAFATTPLDITLEGGRFESPLTRRSIERLPSLVAIGETYQPTGRFDLALTRDAEGVYAGRLLPGQVGVTTERGTIGFPGAEGAIVFAGKRGTFDAITLRSPEATLDVEGSWAIGDDGTVINLRLDAASQGLPEPMLGLAPQTIGEIFDTLEIGVAGETRIEGLALSMKAVPGGLFEDVTARGTARFSDASLAIGLPVTELSGVVGFSASRPDPKIPARFELDIDADRARFKGLRVTNARATVLSGTEPGSVLIPDFAADAHGGRVTASVRISPPAPSESAAPGPRRYWTDLQVAEIRMAPLLEDVRVEPDRALADEVRDEVRAGLESADPAHADEIEASIWDQRDNRSRGLLSASLSFSGTVGTPLGRRGRGRVIAGGGPVVQLPLLTRLIEASNLQIPAGDDLGLAYANLLIDGGRVVLEDFAVLSSRVELLGAGDLTLPGGELDLRVRSRSLNRVPVLTDVVESLRDELISTRISGTIAAPEVVPVAFEETRRVLDSLMGGGPSERLRSIGSSDAGVRQRIREAGALLGRSGTGEAAPTRGGGNDVP